MSRDEIRVGARRRGSHLRRRLFALALAAAGAARCDPMRLSAVISLVSLVAVAGGCGNIIAVPDQGVIILGCHDPSYCYRTDCDCKRANTGATTNKDNPTSCNLGCNGDDQLCECRLTTDDGVPVQCQETAQLCVGRGPLCEGANAYCAASGGSCNGVGDPPQSVPVAVSGPEDQDGGAGTPVLEQHCQFADDTCCHGAIIQDAGVSD
jgi:hypothetical protein